jgi:glycosyltransferase involved in cell wall biosynthesis
MPPMFTVVIPTYNQAGFLKVALRSVLDQTFEDFEIVVVNNESSDHTSEVISQIQAEDSRILTLDYRDSHIIGAVRNAGIAATQGNFVAFLDSDDTWAPNKLERVAEVIAADPEVGLIGHDEEMVREGSPTIRSLSGPPPDYKGSIYDYLLFKGNFVSLSAVVVSRKNLNQVGGFSEETAINTVEDYDLWLNLSEICRFKFISNILGVHIYHSGGASTNVEVHLKATLAVLDKHFNRYQSSNWLHKKWSRNRQYSHAYYGAARQYQRRGAKIKPIGHYFRTLRKYPFHLRAYAGLAILFVDTVFGQSTGQRIACAFWPGGKMESW